MTAHWVRNHSHWGAFFAKVQDDRVVEVRPFERDLDPIRTRVAGRALASMR